MDTHTYMYTYTSKWKHGLSMSLCYKADTFITCVNPTHGVHMLPYTCDITYGWSLVSYMSSYDVFYTCDTHVA